MLELRPFLLGESLLEFEVHQGFAILRLADVQDPFDAATGSSLDADHRVDHPPDAHAPRLELLGDRVVQERGVRGADLHDGAERLVSVLGRVGLEHTDSELILPPGVGQLERADDHTDELRGRSFGQVLRRQPPREGDGERPKGLGPFRRYRGVEELQHGGGQSARGHLVRGAHVAHGTRARTGPRPAASGRARTGRVMRR
jgi:hypothetical protein